MRLPAIFGDNMVLQRTDKCPVWGTAATGQRITVQIGDAIRAETTADASGRWRAVVDTSKLPDTPMEVTVSAGDEHVVFHNALIGEVWFCSGQSNMEWPLVNARDGTKEVAAANHPKMRLFTVSGPIGMTPVDDVQGSWSECAPEVASNFSAVAYFFGRELHEKLGGAPVGLIDDSWGGTNIESWTSAEALRSEPTVHHLIDSVPTDPATLEALRAKAATAIREWEDKTMVLDPGNTGFEKGWANPETSDADWKSMRLPQYWERAGLNIDGVVWFRREVTIPSEWSGRDLLLELGPVDDFDTTYFDNAEVGHTGREATDAYRRPRVYTVPAKLVKPGRAVMAVRVHDWAGDGGFWGEPNAMKLAPVNAPKESAISLARDWRYKVEFEHAPLSAATLFWGRPAPPVGLPDNPNTPTTIFNGRVSPIIPYSIRGAIWYQGENNTGRAYQYRTLLPLLIKDWRARWGQGDFPFYIVQLANFMDRKEEPTQSDWAELREAQLMTTKSVPNTGLAVTIDVGEAMDIHPRDKQTVGHRLVLWALAKTYGKDVACSGPVLESFKVEGDHIRLRFASTGGGLIAKGEKLTGFAIAGADRKFVWADAKVEGDSDVIVRSEKVSEPAAVRYAWASNPACNLYNKADLPASPFRTDDWPGGTINAK